MIDVDRLEEQLDLALTDELRGTLGLVPTGRPVPPSRPASPPRPAKRPALRPAEPAPTARTRAEHPSAGPANDIAALLRAGRLDEAGAMIAERRAGADTSANPNQRSDSARWVAMEALLAGRVDDARSEARAALSLGRQAGHEDVEDRFWTQQYWVVVDYGDDHERYELLDQCRERAYGRSDLYWRSALSLLCARMGRNDEAAREFDASVKQLDAARNVRDPEELCIVTNLAEAAAVLSDPSRGRTLHRALATASDPVVVDERGRVCRGSTARFQALGYVASWKWEESDRAFQVAVDAHRAMDARPLLARTMYEWGLALAGRGDSRAWQSLKESADLARRLHMTGAISGMS